jgi:hypothetical protein
MARKKRNQVRKNSINAKTSHPLYPNKSNAGNKPAQMPIYKSIKINIPNTMVRKVKITINLLGGVHPIFFTT